MKAANQIIQNYKSILKDGGGGVGGGGGAIATGYLNLLISHVVGFRVLEYCSLL